MVGLSEARGGGVHDLCRFLDVRHKQSQAFRLRIGRFRLHHSFTLVFLWPDADKSNTKDGQNLYQFRALPWNSDFQWHQLVNQIFHMKAPRPSPTWCTITNNILPESWELKKRIYGSQEVVNKVNISTCLPCLGLTDKAFKSNWNQNCPFLHHIDLYPWPYEAFDQW